MEDLKKKMAAIDWRSVAAGMNENGYAIVPALLSSQQCEELIKGYDDSSAYRKTVVMERYRFGAGTYKYFDYPLPEMIQTIREDVYAGLAPIANAWMHVLNIDETYPGTLQGLQTLCHANNQLKPTVLILKYTKGGFNTLHQDLYGDIFFPLQAVLFLNEPGTDYTGGEFVLTQQVPRAQSKAMVLKPGKGDMLIFTTNFRPVKGSRGYYRVNMKHGVSELHDGERHTLGVIFHDALS